MGWEYRFFGAAPAALTGQVEGRKVCSHFGLKPAALQGAFPDEPNLKLARLRHLHGVAGPDGPGLLLSISLLGDAGQEAFVIAQLGLGEEISAALLPQFSDAQGRILLGNDLFGEDGKGGTRLFLPFATLQEKGSQELNVKLSVFRDPQNPAFQIQERVPWPDAKVRDAINALSFTVHLLVSLMRVRGGLTPMDIQAIRRDLGYRYALSRVGLKILKRYLKIANRDPSQASELGQLARQFQIFRDSDHQDIIENLFKFATISGDLTDKQGEYIASFATHAGFANLDFDTAQTDSNPWAPASPSHPLKNAYQTLDLPTSASAAKIKKRYRKLVREVHPDRLGHASKKVQTLANEKLAEINQAYELIQTNLARN